MPIEMLPGFTANISMETQIQQNRRYTTIQLDIIHTGDCLQILKTLPDDSVHCCVTSPPYYALRDYGMDGSDRQRDNAEGIYLAPDGSIYRSQARSCVRTVRSG